ncbi:MAG: DNA-binding domain-containing protein [Burkholderiales bacterium]|nr:DNA-binding domain-containing protein [Burkholderiales bacterium]
MKPTSLSPAPALEAFQRDFAAALCGEANSAAAQALAAQPGFAVYRNTVMRGCLDALAANYPVVVRLVGLEWFEGAAREFVRRHPPSDGTLAAYGRGFAEFLETFEPAAELAYLPGVARLDRAWTEAHIAADAPLLTPAALAALSPQRLVEAVLVPHPAARWVCSAALPVFTIWRRHRENLPLDDALAWIGESGLVARPVDQVTWHALDPAAAAFLAACAQGRPFAAAAELAGAAPSGPASSPGIWLPALVAAGAFTRLEIR